MIKKVVSCFFKKHAAKILSSVLAGFSLLFTASGAFAQDTFSAEDMLANFAKNIPNLMRMVTALAYVMGMGFILKGILALKEYGESRSMMSQGTSLKGPMIFLTVGTLLLYLPTSMQVGLSTFWTDPNPYSYLQESDQWSSFLNIVFLIVQFIGTIAFIRGLVIMTQLAGHGGQPGTFSRGLTHIIGGIFCINIYQFTQVIAATFGLSFNIGL
ncbi:MAG: hypothetical protein A3F12_06865 [Gammaproteobacteria bacterium RIFCSPHIGHO2_12_FULL_38_14]|nr:MAG: hypothetical protein A3F12_06865 [Gammaproteobacteria bacterium RIFCSPHIGHO2_12_FULL_38_14]